MLTQKQSVAALDLLAFPAAAPEEQNSGSSDGAFRDDDRNVHTVRSQMPRDREEIRQGNLEQPEAEEMDPSGRYRIACTVEGLQHNHAVSVGNIAVTQNAQAGGSQRHNRRIVCEETNDGRGKDQKEDADAAKKKHVVEAGAPDRNLRTLRLLRTQVLTNQSGGGVAQTPARQKYENKNADGNGVAGQHRRAEHAGDTHEANPTRVRDHELQNAGQRDAHQPKENANVDAELAAQDTNALGPPQKAIELIEHADASPSECSQRRAGDAELREGAPTENEAGVED